MDQLKVDRYYLCVCMTGIIAVASGRASRVLARPLFRRLNVHVRTSSIRVREVVRIV